MRIEDGGGGQEIRFSDIDKYQGNTAQRPFIGFCTCDIVNIALHSLLKNELQCLSCPSNICGAYLPEAFRLSSISGGYSNSSCSHHIIVFSCSFV